MGCGCGCYVGVLFWGIGDCCVSGVVGEFVVVIFGFGCWCYWCYWW